MSDIEKKADAKGPAADSQQPLPYRKQARFVLGDILRIIGIGGILTIAGFVLAYQFVEPAPPGRITIATGGEAGAYFAFGQAYREILAEEKIDLIVKQTSGSLENLALLKTPSDPVEVAFVQGGARAENDTDGLLALGSLYFEPLWIFYSAERQYDNFLELQGKRLAFGVEGSGTRVLASEILRVNNISEDDGTRLLPLSGTAARDALLANEIDALFMVSGINSSLVQSLLHNGAVKLMSFDRAEGYAQVYPFLSPVILHRGAVDFARDLPKKDVKLLAPAVNLVARDDLHPALVDLILRAAFRVHSGPDLFKSAGQFPSTDYLDFPFSEEARRYFKSGDSFLQRYLPFWAATLVDRLAVMIIPLLTLLLPLMRVLPPVYRWRVRSRIYRWYREVKQVESLRSEDEAPELRAVAISELNRIEEEVAAIDVPLAYQDAVYSLRLHIDMIRKKLVALVEAQPVADA